MIQLNEIDTEQKNEGTKHIDTLSTIDIVRLINEEDKKVAFAVEKELVNIAEAVDKIYEALKNGGRLIYCGCGTSGRLGILDAAECPPTFGTDPELVKAVIAGGSTAFIKAVEGAEDNEELGKEDLINLGFSEKDILVGIAASGRTPYVIGAMKYAKGLGAGIVSVTCSRDAMISSLADVAIEPRPGAEVITGSTRMKSGTAQKMVLNMLTTSAMIKLGKVYGNLMVDVKATNEKLLERTVSIVTTVTGAEEKQARKALEQCGFSAKTAIVMIQCSLSVKEAEAALTEAEGHISVVMKRFV